MTEKSTLVLMPGLDGNGKLFEPVIPLLDAHFHLQVITYPSLDSFNEYIDCAYRQLPQEPGYSILAESLSGPVAMALMSRLGDQIGPSVLCSTFGRSPLQTMTELSNLIPSQMISLGALNSFCLDVDDSMDEELTDTQPIPVNVTTQLDGAILKHRLNVLSQIDISALLPSIATPVLVMHGTQDRIVSKSHADMVAQYLPNAHQINLNGPHLLLQTHPHLCIDLIKNHLLKKSG